VLGGVVASEIHIQITYGQNTLVQHWLCRSGDYDKISLIHLDLVKFPLGISKPLEKSGWKK
jgi:hypothetical protein